MNMKLSEALRGMHVKGWEMRVNDSGKKVVYVRYHQDVDVK